MSKGGEKMKKVIKAIYNKIYGDKKRCNNILKTCTDFWNECEIKEREKENA